MHYEILDTDVGQGAGAVAVPVTYGKMVERTDICQPYSVAEVLQNVFHADFQAVLENYVRTETEQIQAAGVLPGAEGMKVRLWSYLKTLSKLQQPTDRTVVDVILQSKLEGEYKGGETRCEDADFRLRYIFNLRVCHQCCIGPLVWVYKDWDDDPALSGFTFDTNDYLLPILYNSDYETVAHAMLNDFFPEAKREIGGDASEFLLSVTDIIASSGEEAEKLLEPTLSKLCNTLSFLLAVDNYNKQSFQPKVYPDWGSAGRDHKRLLPEEKQDGQTIYRDENGKEHIVYTITSGIEIGASVYFRIFGKMQTELFWKYYNLTDPRALYLMEEYCAALGTEQIRSKFFHLFCMIEFVEREYKELAKLECLLSEGQIADICSHAEETLKMDSSMDRNIRENITSILKSRMMQITTKGRAKTLEGILSAMGIERIQDGGNEFKEEFING